MNRLHSFLLMAAIGISNTAVFAASYPEVEFILDASGSMWAKAGNQTRIEAAKDVMAKAVPALAPEVRVGLIAYGHRRKGDCSDIEVLAAAGSEDRTGLLAKVGALQPKGKTPISDAISLAVDQLKTKETETSIVLVSDGLETCAADPCKTVEQLRATGIKFKLHVVGFGVSDADSAQLSCIAQAGGGQYFAAKDADSLLSALTQVSQDVQKQVQVEKAKATQTKAATGLGKIRLTQPAGTDKGMAGLRIIKVPDGKTVKETKALQAESTHPLPAGEYRLEYLFATPNYGAPTVTALGNVLVEPNQTREIKLGSIAFNVAEAFAKARVSQVVLAEAASETPVATIINNNNGYYNFVPKALLPGRYDLLIQYGNSPAPALAASDILVKPGEQSLVTLASGLSLQKPKETQISGWDLIRLDDAVKADEQEDDSNPGSSGAQISARPGGGNQDALWAPYFVPAGNYRLQVLVDGMSEPLVVTESLEIKAGELVQFDSGL